MTTGNKDEAEGFLSRWSQRKRAGAEAEEATGEAAVQEAAAEAAQGEAEPEVDPAELPDIDAMKAGDDFSVFMKKGVPEALQRQALRKLWRLNPVFGHLDGLNDYDLDYTNAATVVENLKSLYQVGKGMVLPEEEEAEKAAEAARAAGGEEAAEAEGAAPAAAAEEAAADAGEEAAAAPVESQARARNPGDPVVSAKATRRSAAPRERQRSALSRRWGDSEA